MTSPASTDARWVVCPACAGICWQGQVCHRCGSPGGWWDTLPPVAITDIARAWAVDTRISPIADALSCAYVIHRPRHHLLYSWWILLAMRSDRVLGDHVIGVAAADPRHAPPHPLERAGSYIRPAPVSVNVRLPGEAQVKQLLFYLLEACIDGTLPLAADPRGVWRSNLSVLAGAFRRGGTLAPT